MNGKMSYGTLFMVGLAGLAVLQCRPSGNTSPSEVEHFFENNQLWAIGQVKLGDLDQIPEISIQTVKTPTVQSLGDYQLIGRVSGENKEVAIVDYHPTENKLLSYVYRLEVVGSRTGQWTVYGRLLKTPKLAKRSMVVLGTITSMPTDQPQKITVASNLNRSVIVDGVMQGFWALHVPEVQKTVVKPWFGICPRLDMNQTAQGPLVVGQSSTSQAGQMPGQSVGQNPLQGPGQGNVCRSLTADLDLCGGDPLAPGCLPALEPMLQVNGPSNEPEALPITIEVIKGAAKIGSISKSYVLDKSAEYAQFSINFPKIAVASEVTNNDLCNKGLLSVQKTVGGLGNPSCSVTVISSAPQSAKVSGTGSGSLKDVPAQSLKCGLQIQIKNPTTYLERVCQLGFELRPALQGVAVGGGIKNEEIKTQINENQQEGAVFQVLVRP